MDPHDQFDADSALPAERRYRQVWDEARAREVDGRADTERWHEDAGRPTLPACPNARQHDGHAPVDASDEWAAPTVPAWKVAGDSKTTSTPRARTAPPSLPSLRHSRLLTEVPHEPEVDPDEDASSTCPALPALPDARLVSTSSHELVSFDEGSTIIDPHPLLRPDRPVTSPGSLRRRFPTHTPTPELAEPDERAPTARPPAPVPRRARVMRTTRPRPASSPRFHPRASLVLAAMMLAFVTVPVLIALLGGP